jgi:predicted phosphodiesterase
MKFQLFSDIHLELCKNIPYIKPLTDYLFLAGDIGNISKPNLKLFIDYCSKNWKKTFYVLGNHEFYHNNKIYDTLIKAYNELVSSYDNIYILNDSFYDLELDTTTQYRIYGSVLWSNINSTETINDFNMIKMKNEKNWTVPMDLKYFNQLHSNSLKKLLDEVKIANLENKKLIVITHFPPVRNNTSHPKYSYQPNYLRNYFSNDFTEPNLLSLGINEKELYTNIECWISGHTHYSYDFKYKTRFISNQLGYVNEIDDTGINYNKVFEI